MWHNGCVPFMHGLVILRLRVRCCTNATVNNAANNRRYRNRSVQLSPCKQLKTVSADERAQIARCCCCFTPWILVSSGGKKFTSCKLLRGNTLSRIARRPPALLWHNGTKIANGECNGEKLFCRKSLSREKCRSSHVEDVSLER